MIRLISQFAKFFNAIKQIMNLLEIDKKHENNTAVFRNRCVAVKLSTGRWR